MRPVLLNWQTMEYDNLDDSVAMSLTNSKVELPNLGGFQHSDVIYKYCPQSCGCPSGGEVINPALKSYYGHIQIHTYLLVDKILHH